MVLGFVNFDSSIRANHQPRKNSRGVPSEAGACALACAPLASTPSRAQAASPVPRTPRLLPPGPPSPLHPPSLSSLPSFTPPSSSFLLHAPLGTSAAPTARPPHSPPPHSAPAHHAVSSSHRPRDGGRPLGCQRGRHPRERAVQPRRGRAWPIVLVLAQSRMPFDSTHEGARRKRRGA